MITISISAEEICDKGNTKEMIYYNIFDYRSTETNGDQYSDGIQLEDEWPFPDPS